MPQDMIRTPPAKFGESDRDHDNTLNLREWDFDRERYLLAAPAIADSRALRAPRCTASVIAIEGRAYRRFDEANALQGWSICCNEAALSSAWRSTMVT